MALTDWFQVVRRLHPALRRQRRVIRACEKAFDEGEYELVRIRINTGEPSIGDFFPGPHGLLEVPRYFTYDIETEEAPDFSGASRAERRIVRRYLRRNADHVHHHGREPLRPKQSSPSSETEDTPPSAETGDAAPSERTAETARPRRSEDARLSASVTLEDRSLWFGEIELYEDAIVVSGWTWSGPTAETIPLPSVTMFETWSERDGTNFRLGIDGAAPVQGRIRKGIGLWEVTLETDERVDVKRRLNA